MHYYEKFNSVIIYGGKTEGSQEKAIQNKIYLLKLNNLNWQEVVCLGDSVPKRAGFASVIA